MKGIVIDCKTGKLRSADDGLPMPPAPAIVLNKGVDLERIQPAVDKVTDLEARVIKLEGAHVL